ncbi:oxidoreductase [Halomonas denitrificans]|uniref:acrylyl-CoA reductase (NADPH) n=1 Tax=Halomonas denitrificans TaxID=370769 RepID=UPI001CD2F3F3|nr:MDR family oxidoreductase [Halomonas denitrificans]MCA0975734.1 oxidoreductase [Halomonas denitrificans]
MFKAIVIRKEDDHQQVAIESIHEQDLPEGNVTVAVDYSTLNYKDGLAITGKGPVVRSFPMVPGIDLAGTVTSSSHGEFAVGDQVVLNGWGVGETHWGGLAEKARLNGDWLIPLPTAFSTKSAMAIGTAGYTAMLSVMALERHGVTPDQGEVLVTGASGGVGSFAVSLLAKLGYQVTAATGKVNEAEYLKSLGARTIIDRQELVQPGKPLQKERWAGAIDSVGSHTLSNVVASTRYGGTVTCCGLAQGMDLPGTVMPFILRGVTLAGIDSVMQPKAVRMAAWQRLAELLSNDSLEQIATEIPLSQAVDAAERLIDGQIKGRVVVATR